jgi:hypothetical protein
MRLVAHKADTHMAPLPGSTHMPTAGNNKTHPDHPRYTAQHQMLWLRRFGLRHPSVSAVHAGHARANQAQAGKGLQAITVLRGGEKTDEARAAQKQRCATRACYYVVVMLWSTLDQPGSLHANILLPQVKRPFLLLLRRSRTQQAGPLASKANQ